jgi:hypothetical protein
MPKLLVTNGTDKSVDLVVEPWADVVALAPNESADFEYDEPAAVDLLLQPGGGALVFVASRRLRFSARGREETWEDKTGFVSSLISSVTR